MKWFQSIDWRYVGKILQWFTDSLRTFPDNDRGHSPTMAIHDSKESKPMASQSDDNPQMSDGGNIIEDDTPNTGTG